jgi:uncharacterized membrane protein YdbT with pleckstrin-like domain
MTPEQAATPVQQKPIYNPLEVMQPGEQVICEIKRHPIGLFGIYVVAGLVLVMAISTAILAPMYLTFLTDEQKTGILLSAGLVAILDIIFTYISIYIYQANRWVVTSDSVTQITQNSLFDHHANQLSLAKLEDVSAEQHNLIQELFGFGDITLETAGADRDKFVFAFCPNPHEYARKIIAAQEAFMARRNEEYVMAPQPAATTPPTPPVSPLDPTNLPPVSGGVPQSPAA